MTDRYVVLGDPIAHSLSPAIQQAALDAAGIDATFMARRVDEEGVSAAIDELRRGELAGANVTMPHKQAAARFADVQVGHAVRLGVANTLWAEEGDVHAASTDPDGVRYAVAHHRFPSDGPVYILGAGGAAAAALVAFDDRPVRIAARREEAARALVVRVASDASVLPWGSPVAGATLVNATPLGMAGESLPPSAVDAASAFLDLTYGERISPTVSLMSERSLPAADGRAMLIGQGMASFKLWTGVEASEAAMWAAISTAQSG